MSTTVVVNSFAKTIANNFVDDTMSQGVNNMSGYQSFADFVREKVGSRSQRDIARKAQVSPTTIGNYLLGRIPDLGDIDLIDRLAYALDSTPEEIELVIREEKRRRSQEAAMRVLEKEPDTVKRIQFALNGAEDLSELSKQQLMEMVRDFAEKHRKKDKD